MLPTQIPSVLKVFLLSTTASLPLPIVIFTYEYPDQDPLLGFSLLIAIYSILIVLPVFLIAVHPILSRTQKFFSIGGLLALLGIPFIIATSFITLMSDLADTNPKGGLGVLFAIILFFYVVLLGGYILFTGLSLQALLFHRGKKRVFGIIGTLLIFFSPFLMLLT